MRAPTNFVALSLPASEYRLAKRVAASLKPILYRGMRYYREAPVRDKRFPYNVLCAIADGAAPLYVSPRKLALDTHASLEIIQRLTL
jgi:hypothetical protein